MQNIVNKITSRKFIVTVVIIIAGLATAFKNASNEKIQIAGYVMAGVAAIAYVAIEGTVDKASVADIGIKTIKAIEEIKGDEKNEKSES